MTIANDNDKTGLIIGPAELKTIWLAIVNEVCILHIGRSIQRGEYTNRRASLTTFGALFTQDVHCSSIWSLRLVKPSILG
jgi:hypothetical protein